MSFCLHKCLFKLDRVKRQICTFYMTENANGLTSKENSVSLACVLLLLFKQEFFFKVESIEKLDQRISQENRFSLDCVSMCLFRRKVQENTDTHITHWNGISPVHVTSQTLSCRKKWSIHTCVYIYWPANFT